MNPGVYCFDQLPGSLWLMPDIPPADRWALEIQFADSTPVAVVTTDDGTSAYPMVPFVPLSV